MKFPRRQGVIGLALMAVAVGCSGDEASLAPMKLVGPSNVAQGFVDGDVVDPVDPEAAVVRAIFRFDPPLNDGVGASIVRGEVRANLKAARMHLDYFGTLTPKTQFADGSERITVVNQNDCSNTYRCEKWEEEALPNFCAPDDKGYAPGMDANGLMNYSVKWLSQSLGPNQTFSEPHSCPKIVPAKPDGSSGSGGVMLIICTTTDYYSASGVYLYRSITCRTETYME